MDQNKLYRDILRLIARDIKVIKRNKGQLSPADALTLSRYASTLQGIQENQEKAEGKKVRDLEKLPTDELVKLYLEGKQ